MKKQTVIMAASKHLDRAILLCRRAHGEDKVHEVIIREYKVNLSGQQRKLYWFWLGIIGNELGYDKDALHLIMKKQFLIQIYVREHEGFAEMVEAVKQVKAKDEKTWRVLADHILENTSIMDAKVSEMKEYLTAIDRDAASNDIRLPLPADRGLDNRIWKR